MTRSKLALSTILGVILSLATAAMALADGGGNWLPK
jgi:hypothetical protein